MRLGIGRQRLAGLLGPAEMATKREVFAERKALRVRLPHQDPPQIGVSGEHHAEHVVHLTLQPVRAAPQPIDRLRLQRPALVERQFQPQIGSPLERSELVDQLEWHLGIPVFHRGDVREVVEALALRVPEPCERIERGVAPDIDDGVATGDDGPLNRVAEPLPEGPDRG